MSIKTKRRLRKTIMIVVLVIIAAIYIYPVYLMFMNSFKPFGEIVADVLAFPKKFDLSNYTYYRDWYCRNYYFFIHGSLYSGSQKGIL